VRLLLKNPNLSLEQYSMKHGTPLHVSLYNKDFKNSLKIIQIMKEPSLKENQYLNRVDEEDNTILHIVMRHFNSDIDKSRRIALGLLHQGANLSKRSKVNCTPLLLAFAYG